MALLFLSREDDPAPWRAALTDLVPGLDFRIWPDCGAEEDIDCALVWRQPPGELRRFPALKAIISLGAGVDHILRDSSLPDVPIVRLVDDSLTGQMVEYALWAVLHHHRRIDDYAAQQRAMDWTILPPVLAQDRSVGVMGLGELGGAVARALAVLGFRVAGWSRRPKNLPGIESFAGQEGLEPFLARSEIVVCVLPLTPGTVNILDARAFAALPQGAAVINIARGGLLGEGDLLAALESGHLAGATLDVFRQEPLPPGHPFWTHPRVTLTPHVAGRTIPARVAPQVARAILAVRAGGPLAHVVDRAAGY